MASVQAFLDVPSATGALVLEGEPGIGKTTLWRAGVDAARERGRRVLTARPAEAERELSFSALADLLGPELDRLEALSPPRRRALEVALQLSAGEGAALDARAIGLATLDLLRLLAEEQPLLVALDDTQWLDPPSRETLTYALRRLDREPVALLVAQRPDAAEFVLGPSKRVGVGPLSLGGLSELLREQVTGMFTRPTLVRIHETSGGNPFFALELARALEGRVLRFGEPLPVPASLGELTASRFERLDAEAREVLLFVAALARPTRDVLTAAAGDRATRALEEAAAAGLIEVDGSRLRFTHPLLASVHYGSATRDVRAGVHRRLAAVVTDAEERGRHLGAAATEPDAEVAAALDEAAAAARSRGAPAAAAELAEVAVRLTPPTDSASLPGRLCAAADHHFAAGSTAHARSLLEQAFSDAPPGPERARVALQLARVLEAKDLVGERPLLEQALPDAEGDVALQGRIHHQLAVHFDGLDYRESRRHAHIALELAERTGDLQLIAETLAWAFDRDFWIGAGIDHELIGRGLSLEDELPQLALVSRPSCAYAWALEWSGELEQAGELWERLRALGRSEGDLDVIHILFFSTYHELIAEDWEQAARFADEAWALAVEAERDVEISQCRRARATVDAYRGQVGGTRSAAEEAHRLGAAAGFSEQSLSGLALGVLELSLGEPASALAELRPLTQKKLSRGVKEPGLMLGFPEHVEAAVACRELDEASEVLDFVEEHARRLDRAWALGCCARGRALLATARGEEAAADRAFALSYQQHARRPQQLPTYELARTLLAHGSILRRRREQRQAREALERALAIFERLGAEAYAERARSELARIGGRAPSGGGLTVTERRLAEVVAEGRSNKEAAAVLFVTPKTVETKLSRIYAKLGIHSRGELARHLAGPAKHMGDSNRRPRSRDVVGHTEIVGRDEELQALSSFLGESAAPGAVLVEGDAGIGKTTLWRWAVDHAAERGWHVLTAAPAAAEARLAFAGIGDLLGGTVDAVVSQLPPPQKQALGVALLLEDARGRPADERTVAVAVLGALRALARERTLLVAVDDVQWLDRPSAEVLSFVARRLGDDSVGLLLAQRTDEASGVPLGLERAFGERLRRVSPRPLSLGATHHVLRSQLGLTLPRPALRRVHTGCGGNPFFALEMGRVLQERGDVLAANEPLPVPHDVEQLVERRIERLTRPGREAVLAAALMGVPSAEVVEQAADKAGLEEALSTGVLIADGDGLQFAHTLLAEAATSLTPESRRRDMHKRLAALVADPEAHAQHLALGTSEPDAAVAAAIDRAAEIARRRGATASAAALAEHAARLTPAGDSDAVARRTTAAALWWTDAGDTRRCLALVEPLLGRLPTGTLRLEALNAKARAVEDRRVHRGLLEDAVAEADGYPSHQVRLLVQLCYALSHELEFDAARERAHAAVEIAERTGDSTLVVLALSMAGRLNVGIGGLEVLRRARDLEPAAVAVDAYESPATWLGWWLLANDEVDAARRLLVDQHRRAIDDGDEWNRTVLHWPLTEVECRAGDYDAARAYAEEGSDLAEQSDNLYALWQSPYCLGLVAAHVGECATASAYAEDSLTKARAVHSEFLAVRPRIVLGFLAVSEERYEEALRHLDGLAELAMRGPYSVTYPFWGDLFEALVSLGEVERAQSLLADLDVRRHAVARPGDAPVLARCRGLVLAASGSLEESVPALEAALRLQEARPVPLERARTLLALGEVQRRAKQRRAARETLQEALRSFESLGTPLWAERARKELARIGGRGPSVGRLTVTERRLAELVAEGRSNKEAAAALFVTPKTVETKLSRIYAKLGIHSRAELARRHGESKL